MVLNYLKSNFKALAENTGIFSVLQQGRYFKLEKSRKYILIKTNKNEQKALKANIKNMKVY